MATSCWLQATGFILMTDEVAYRGRRVDGDLIGKRRDVDVHGERHLDEAHGRPVGVVGYLAPELVVVFKGRDPLCGIAHIVCDGRDGLRPCVIRRVSGRLDNTAHEIRSLT